MYLLEVEPLDLGEDVRALGLELVENNQDREPVRGRDAARIWARVLSAVAATENWALDFFSHLDRVREYCGHRDIAYREPNHHCLTIPEPPPAPLEDLLDRFQKETFGARAGGAILSGD